MNGERGEKKRRLFVALWPPDQLRSAIERETRRAVRASGGRVIPAENLHITLAFLGATRESQVPVAQEALQSVVVQPFEVILGRMKWWARQQVLCLEPTEGVAALDDLAQRVQSELRAKGFELEDRPFRAHLTLARDVRREHTYEPINALQWPVSRIELIESRTLPSGSVYTALPR